MNVDDESKEAVPDLRILLNQGTGSHLIESSGAGANAASRVDMAFVASDHLTELVWSPRKGLSVKCTNCNTAAEESRLTLGMGKGNKVASTYQANDSRAVMAVTSAMSPGTNEGIGTSSVNEGLRCNSSSHLKDVSQFNIKSTLKVPGRKSSSHSINKDKDLCLLERAMQSRVGLAPNINLQSTSGTREENQMGIAFKKQEVNIDDDFAVAAIDNISPGFLDETEVKNESNPVTGKMCQGENSATETEIDEYRRKGKAKALSDTKIQDESCGSIESCNSVESFCSRRKKRCVGQDFVNESKRIKTTIQPSPYRTSLVEGRRSSFISWISNMIKGIDKGDTDGTPCLPLTLTPDRHRPQHEWELVSNRNNDKYPCQKVGFQNFFESMYCASSKVYAETAVSDEPQKNVEPIDACMGPMGNTMVDVTPLSMHGMMSSSGKGGQSSGNGNRHLKLQDVQSKIVDNSEHNSPETGGSCNMLTKVRTIKLSASKSSPDKCKTENHDSDPPQEIKAGSTSVMDPLQSFWVTRFCPKSPIPQSVADNHGQIVSLVDPIKHPDNRNFRSYKVSKVAQPKGVMVDDLNKLVARQEDEASDSDASNGVEENTNLNAQSSEFKIDQIFSTETLKCSEAMASMFARRLDALKHMSPSGLTVTENEVEDLLDSIGGSPENTEITPCLCIRCFQLGHWATDCQIGPCKVSVCKSLLLPSSESLQMFGNKHMQVENRDIPIAADVPTITCNQKGPEPDTELHKSGCVNYELEETAAAPLSNFVDGQSSDILKGYFDAVRLLRLSRREVLKFIDSKALLSHLQGFFLRLRLGNLEKGLGVYHVAYVDGVESEAWSKGAKLVLPVNIGNTKCLVGSQSISNQDFLEDELMAWWSATIRNGSKLPTQEELSSKLLERNKLGL
uniref:Plus3 domain-containing protein n=1 Tax=Kalanchoe fedtschenkoi TaxID=63787 RepID=A0A7N0UUL0_KALFE